MTYPDQHSAPGGTGSTTISTPGIGTPTSTRPHAPYAPSSLALSALADFATSKRSGGKHSHSHSEQPPLRIRTIRFGQWDIDTWYDAPFAEEYNNIPEGRLWMCEFCLKYMKSGFGWERHQVRSLCLREEIWKLTWGINDRRSANQGILQAMRYTATGSCQSLKLMDAETR
jgi:hypothetical protein